MTGIVLAGGESRRMGTDKAFLKIAGLPMIEHIIRALRSVAGRIIVVSNSPAAFSSYPVETTGDVWKGRGSLIGLYSGLRASREDFNFVVACDMPFLNPGLIGYMAGLTGDYDVILPEVAGFAEPLHSVYHRRLVPDIERRLEQDQLAIRSIFEGRRIRRVTEAEIDRFDPMRRSFRNINTPKEYEEVTCSDLECRSC